MDLRSADNSHAFAKGRRQPEKLSVDCLPRRKTRMRLARRLEAEYDILLADAHLHKFVHHLRPYC